MSYLYKNRRFWEVLKRIRAIYANWDGYSYIRAAFGELHLEKQALEENTQNYIQNNNILKNHIYLSCARKLYTEINRYTRRFY